MSPFKFSFGQRVILPSRPDVSAIVTCRGEDMDYGRYYVLEWMCARGRPAARTFWESDLRAANPAAPATTAKRKSNCKRKSSRKRR